MKNERRTKMLILALCVALCLAAAFAVVALAADTGESDATVAIEAAFSASKVGDTKRVSNDGYIGIPVEITTYYDYAKHGAAKKDYNGTPLVIYVVNTKVERIGAKTDVEIIKSMLDDGYIVAVLDYLNNAKAKSPDLDWSTQTIRKTIMGSSYFGDTTKIPSGTYYSNYIVPAGYDVSIRNVFWEADKHGADGTLDKIVENWNTDFRGWFRDTVIYWLNSDGEKKATQNGFDGSAPQWYSDAKGTAPVDATSPDAKYIKAQHTLANDITDCTGKDGTPIDLNLYMDIVYPTTAEGEDAIAPVPIAVLANSSEYLSTASTGSGLRPQHNGFLFNGYAGAVFDYLYQPMAQSDYYGYYDGRTELGALTGDRMNYGLHLYNDKRINTAAMRYLRYLTLTEPQTYSFDITSIGVFGNSKGGWFTFLGEEELRDATTVISGKTLAQSIDARINSYTSKRLFVENSYKTRHDMQRATYTKNGVKIDGGELQPWLTYKDAGGVEREVPSYASWIYASNGAQDEDVTKGHAPIFAAIHLQDDFSTYTNAFGELTGCLNDIPSFFVVVDLGHTFAYGPDYYRGFDTYQAMFDFANYYLRGDAVKVVYTVPETKTGELETTTPITIKFSGAVPESEIEKVTLVSEGGKVASGSWSYVRGMTEWTFTPDALASDSKYILTVPSDLKGDNGKAIGSAQSFEYHTVAETSVIANTVKTAKGTYFVVNVPAIGDASDARIRFHVANDAANVAALYSVSSFNSSSPDSSVVGALVGKVNLKGAGYYEIDATDEIAAAEGSQAVFLLCADKTASVTEKSADVSAVSIGAYARKSGETEAPDGTAAIGFYVNENIKTNGTNQYPHEVFYANTSTLFSASNLFTTSNITPSDLGRKYTVTMRVYDTASRVIQLSFNSVATATNGVHDFDKVSYNFMTEAGKWQDITFDYVVYEPEYGACSLTKKTLTVKLGTTGESEAPIYVQSLKVKETVSALELDSDDPATLVLGQREAAIKNASADKPFSIGSTSYSTLGAALAAAKSGNTVVMNKNYTLTSADSFTGWCNLEKITLDLGGYKLYAESGTLINARATSLKIAKTYINLKNGSVYLYNSPLVSYTGSSAAGEGKAFDITLDSLNILNARGSRLTDVLSASTIEAASGADVKISVVDSNIDFRKGMNVNNPTSIMPVGEGSLNLSYEIAGGSIYFDTLYVADVCESLKKAEFIADANGNYTTFITPESVDTSRLSVMRADGIASLKSTSLTDNVASYLPAKSELSTRYGLIPEAYADKEAYPFVLFDENGNFKGAYSAFVGNGDNGTGGVLGAAKGYVVNAWNGTSYGNNPKEAFIVMRRDYTFSSTSDIKFANFAQLQGTVNIDLGGYTLSSGTVAYPIFPAFSKGYSGSASGNPIFPSTVIVNNGTIRQYKSGVVAMSTWDSAGGGTIKDKNFNFIFNNVTFGFVDNADSAGLIAHAWSKTGTPGAAAPFNFEYNDCTFDLRTTKSRYNPVMFSFSSIPGNYIKLTIEVNGGKIIADDASKVTVVGTTTSDTYGSSITFNKGSDGEYTKYYVPTGKAVAIGNYGSKDGTILGFVKSGADGNDDVYTLKKNPLVTKYGTIPEANSDTEAYPFVVFRGDGTFHGAYSLFAAAVSAAKAYNASNVWDAQNGTYGSAARSAVVLMRRDYTTKVNNYTYEAARGDKFDDWGQNKGVITIDLGGYTLTQGSGADGIFTYITSKGWGGAIFPSTYNVTNGNVRVLNSAAMKVNIWATVYGNKEMAGKTFTWNFDNVSFGFAAGATASNLLISYHAPQNTGSYPPDVEAPFFFNFNNCEYDLVTNAPSAGATLFNAAPASSQWIKSTMTVSGGEIKAPSLTLAKLYKTETTCGSSVTFKKNSDGEYTKLYIVPGGSVPSGNVITDDGAMQFVKTRTDTDYVLYTISDLTTDYGDIPSGSASVEDYPFAVFDTDGKFYGAYKNLLGSQGGALGCAIYTVLQGNKWDAASGKYVSEGTGSVKTAIILLRSDYTMTKDEYHNNFAHAQGTVIIDLGGHTIYSDSSRTKPIFDSTAKGWSGSSDGVYTFPCTYIVKNGEFRVHSASVLSTVCNDSLGSNAIANKTMDWTFQDVTFGLMKGATVENPLLKIENASTTSGVLPFNLTYNNCTVDLASVAPTVSTTVFNAGFLSSSYTKGTVKVNGGCLIANNLENIVINSLNTSNGSSLTFDSGFKVYLAHGAPAPSYNTTFNTVQGEATLNYLSTANGEDAYMLVLSMVTKYGNIPARFASVEEYPFITFRNGKFVAAASLFGKDATASALHNSKSNGSVILLRRDFDYNESQYNNLSQTNGSITIDLDGHTFYCLQTGTNPLFYAQKKTQYTSSLTIINGTILTAKNPIIRFTSWAGSSGSYKGGEYFNFTFNNVTLGAVDGTSPETLIAVASQNTGEPKTYGTLTLNNCVIDLSGLSATTLFDINDGSGIIVVTVKMNGGKIVADETAGIVWSVIASGNSVTFAKGDDGNYPVLYALDAPSASFATPEGDMKFVKVGCEGESGVYNLAASSISGFVPKVSVSLYSNFVYNIYIPVEYDISKIVLADAQIDMNELEISEIDGKEYYHLTRSIIAPEAAESFVLEVTLDVDGNSTVGRWTLDIIKYARLVLEDENTTEIEARLMKDMLSYIRSAYIYFDREGADEIRGEINSIIGGSYDSSSVPDESALDVKTSFEGLEKATMDLGATPAFIFVPETNDDGSLVYEAERYTFSGDGRNLEGEVMVDGDGTVYIKVLVYAYGMSMDIDYSIEGTDISGSYNIRTYYEYAKTLDDANLVSVVQRLWKYSDSAEDYRKEVTSK